jgi:transposase
MSDDFDIRLERKLESKAAGAGGGVSEVRRIELITGIGRRRRWSSEDKARIVEESLASGVGVSEVARRHGLSPQQLFAWRRQARALLHEAGNAPRRWRRGSGQSATPGICNDAPTFAPVVITGPARSSPRISARSPAVVSNSIEIAIDDAVVRVIGPVETEALVAVLRAVRRAS